MSILALEREKIPLQKSHSSAPYPQPLSPATGERDSDVYLPSPVGGEGWIEIKPRYTPPIPTQFLSSPLGILKIESNGEVITRVAFSQKKSTNAPDTLTKKCAEELEEYCKGKRTTFTVPTDASGTAFQKSVWREMQKIPYGKTMSYAEIARRIRKAKAMRAVGTACGANPIVILLPCHRVVGSKGPGGYSGGLEKKEWLLARESKV